MPIPTLSEIIRATVTLGTLALVFKVLASLAKTPYPSVGLDVAGNGVLFGLAGMLLIAAIVKLWSKRAS